jgi:hypothetical protein
MAWQGQLNGGNSNQRIERMAAVTLDRVLTEAEALPAEEQEILENLLRRRRIETWRQETAAEAKSAIKAFRSGKLKSQSVENLIASLRKAK